MYLLIGAMGILALVAPIFLSYSDNQPALWTSFVIGSLLVLSSVFELLDQDKNEWEYLIAGTVGTLAVAAPFILGFDNLINAVWTMVLVGVVSIIASGTKLFAKTNDLGV